MIFGLDAEVRELAVELADRWLIEIQASEREARLLYEDRGQPFPAEIEQEFSGRVDTARALCEALS